MRYDTNWLDGYMALEWRDAWQQVDTDEGVSIAFDDEGEYDGIHLFLKAGRTTELRSDLRLTAGVHGFVHWTRSRESPRSSENVAVGSTASFRSLAPLPG